MAVTQEPAEKHSKLPTVWVIVIIAAVLILFVTCCVLIALILVLSTLFYISPQNLPIGLLESLVLGI